MVNMLVYCTMGVISYVKIVKVGYRQGSFKKIKIKRFTSFTIMIVRRGV
jgi:hypothetical protein